MTCHRSNGSATRWAEHTTSDWSIQLGTGLFGSIPLRWAKSCIFSNTLWEESQLEQGKQLNCSLSTDRRQALKHRKSWKTERRWTEAIQCQPKDTVYLKEDDQSNMVSWVLLQVKGHHH